MRFVVAVLELIAIPLAVAALSGLAAVGAPSRLRRARDTAVGSPVTAALAGLCTLGAAAGLSFLYVLSLVLIIPLILIPLAALAWLALAILILAGWVEVAEPVGRIILARMYIYPAPMVATVVGAFALTFGFLLLNLVPLIGMLANLIAGLLMAVGLGAVLLTRMGARTYPAITIQRVETA